MKSFVKEILVRRISSAVALIACIAVGARGSESKATRPAGLTSFANAPMYFEAGAGEAGQFIARGAGCGVRLAPTEAEIILGTSEDETATRSVRLQLVGANSSARMAGRDEMPARANYLIGNDHAKWRTGISLFSKVQADDIYPGVQVVYYANQSAQLEYDFLLQQGAQPGQIRFHIEGADSFRVDAAGNLALKIGGEEIKQHKPVAYQESGGVRREVPASYHLNADGTVGFALGEYDRSLPLVIDPVLDFMTYMGGKKEDIAWAVALDGDQNVYVAGESLSTGLLTTNAILFGAHAFTNFQGGTHAFGDAFVAKYDTSGVLQFLTYLGGRTDDGALGIAYDSVSQAVWVTGFTDSTNFPLQNPIRSQLTGPNKNAKRIFPVDAFIAKLDPSGTNLLFSTYFGGENIDEGVGITVDANGFVYVTGLTGSTNLPGVLPNAFQTNGHGNFDAFVTKLASAVPNIYTNVYTTFFGGTNTDYGLGIAADSKQDAWITGLTLSTNFYTTNAIQLTYGFFPNGHTFTNLNAQTNAPRHNFSIRSDAFVAEISQDGTTVPFSTLLGGTNDDFGERITIDNSDNVYVTGYTFSRDFPTNVITVPTTNTVTVVTTNSETTALETNTYGPENFIFPTVSTNFFSHVFVTEFTNSTPAYALAFSTHFGGNFSDQGMGIAVDSNGLIYVTGSVGSTNFFATNIIVLTNSSPPITNHHNVQFPGFSVSNPIFTNLSSTNTVKLRRVGGNTNDIFVAVLAPGMSNFLQSIIIGGAGEDDGNGIAVDPAGNAVYIVGSTTSITNFATTNAAQQFFGGGKSSRRFSDAFVGKIQIVPSP